jgi:hypothetical protein
MATICLWSQRNFFNALSHINSPPQAAAIEPGYFGTVQAPPRSLCAQVRQYAAARGENARKSCLICLLNLFCSWINFFAMAEDKESVGVAKNASKPAYEPAMWERVEFKVMALISELVERDDAEV